jgi:hypothetical protein
VFAREDSGRRAVLSTSFIVSAIGIKAAVGYVAELPAFWCAFLPAGGDLPQ